MKEARSSHASASFKDNSVIVFMGIGSNNKNIKSIEKWTFGTSSWKELFIRAETDLLTPTNCLRAIEITNG